MEIKIFDSNGKPTGKFLTESDFPSIHNEVLQKATETEKGIVSLTTKRIMLLGDPANGDKTKYGIISFEKLPEPLSVEKRTELLYDVERFILTIKNGADTIKTVALFPAIF